MSEPFCFQMSISEFIENNFKEIRAPFFAGIELTAKCNLHCLHCYAKNGIADSDMTTEEVYQIIDKLCESGTLGIYLTGGEALLRPDFFDIYRYAKKKGMSVSVLSNITLLNETHIALFTEYPVSEVSTTLYGATEQTYEAVTGVKGSYQKFVKALQLLQENQIPVSLKYVTLRENYHEVYLAQEFAEQHHCRMMTAFSIYSAANGDPFPLQHRVSPQEAFHFDLHDKKRNAFWKQKAQELYLERIGKKEKHIYARKEEGYFYPCDISWHSTFISHLGRMQACTKTSYQSYDLLHGDFQTGWDFLKKEFRDKKKSFACLQCEKFHYCEQCTANFLCDNHSEPQIDPFYCGVAQLRYDYIAHEVQKIEEEE